MKSFKQLLSFTFLFVSCAPLMAHDDVKLETGAKAPSFKATSIDGKEISNQTFRDADVMLVVFTCNGCPVAKAYEDRMIALAKKYQDKKVAVVAINNHHAEDLEAMKDRAKEKGFNFVYAYEGSGKSARDFGAKVTPHCFVLNKERKVVYQGAFDDSMKEPKNHFVDDAISATLSGKEVKVTFKRAFGCGIKFKK